MNIRAVVATVQPRRRSSSLPLVGRVAHPEQSEGCDGWGLFPHRDISRIDMRCPHPALRATPERASLVSAPQEWEGKERTSFAPRPINGREKKRRVSLASRMARRDRGGAGDWLAVWRFEIERGCSFLSLPRSSWGGWRGAPGGVTRARTKTAPTPHIVRARSRCALPPHRWEG